MKTLIKVYTILLFQLPIHLFSQPSNYSLDFDGQNSYVEIATNTNMSPTQSVTVEAWVKGTFSQNRAFIYDRIEVSDGYGLTVESKLAGLTINGGHGIVVGNTNVQDGNWHHIAGVYNRSKGKLYIYTDGILEDSLSYIDPISYFTEPRNAIGGLGGAQYFEGLIDEVRVWNIARSSSQILQHKDSCLSGNENGLVGYWRFEEGSGNIALDLSIHSNHGNLKNNVNWDNDVPFVRCKPNGIDYLSQNMGNISIYPNPSPGLIYLELQNTDVPIHKIHIYNHLGNLVYRKILLDQNLTEIDLAKFEGGMYFVEVLTDKGLISFAKLIIE